ncbi:hypothetical protein E2C01_017421 [Portunus trituberculatus]|uniref:Uncharacterized protein n=1 Tax=Portunus trituberculatus TaxID=210409 RepID=A0A5B7DRT8_PORTR|nr:hypothetical protein [Portunus trituberculatus]
MPAVRWSPENRRLHTPQTLLTPLHPPPSILKAHTSTESKHTKLTTNTCFRKLCVSCRARGSPYTQRQCPGHGGSGVGAGDVNHPLPSPKQGQTGGAKHVISGVTA